jgi:hypothetical protein
VHRTVLAEPDRFLWVAGETAGVSGGSEFVSGNASISPWASRSWDCSALAAETAASWLLRTDPWSKATARPVVWVVSAEASLGGVSGHLRSGAELLHRVLSSLAARNTLLVATIWCEREALRPVAMRDRALHALGQAAERCTRSLQAGVVNCTISNPDMRAEASELAVRVHSLATAAPVAPLRVPSLALSPAPVRIETVSARPSGHSPATAHEHRLALAARSMLSVPRGSQSARMQAAESMETHCPVAHSRVQAAESMETHTSVGALSRLREQSIARAVRGTAHGSRVVRQRQVISAIRLALPHGDEIDERIDMLLRSK